MMSVATSLSMCHQGLAPSSCLHSAPPSNLRSVALSLWHAERCARSSSTSFVEASCVLRSTKVTCAVRQEWDTCNDHPGRRRHGVLCLDPKVLEGGSAATYGPGSHIPNQDLACTTSSPTTLMAVNNPHHFLKLSGSKAASACPCPVEGGIMDGLTGGPTHCSGHTHFVGRIHLGTPVQQQGHHVLVTQARSLMHWCLPFLQATWVW
jgi:hypothetical protein